MRIELALPLDPHAAEALRLEILRLAREHGVDLVSVEARRADARSA
ncbi:MAG: hypothetical protein HY294_10615 [Candidatus Rokubacteria bacterium]|nr:hypothetical protein [Candidatus Rokubacteria bacterium]MBI3826436.1 hypothetical protein [Candidatus Rokubacteria bacterium]